MTVDLFDKTSSPDQDSLEDFTTQAKEKFAKEDGTIDVDALVKSWGHSQKHIEDIENENEGMRSDLRTRMTMEQFMDKMNKTTPQSNPDNTNRAELEDTTNQVSALDEAKVATLAEQVYNRNKQADMAKQNFDYVSNELAKTWGPNFKQKLEARAQELGTNKDFLNSMALTHPKAFLELVIPKKEAVYSDFAPPSSSSRTVMPEITGTTSQQNTWNQYEKMRKQDPAKYWSIPVQRELHRLAKEGKLPNT